MATVGGSSGFDSRVFTKAIQDGFLICKICSNEYEDPRVLPCFHSFCASCLETLVQNAGSRTFRKSEVVSQETQEEDASREPTLPCSVCGIVSKIPPGDVTEKVGFPKNVFLQKVQAAAAKVKTLDPHCGNYPDNCDNAGEDDVQYCKGCESFYCLVCIVKHDSMKPLKGHCFISAAEATEFITEAALKEALICETHKGEELKFYCEEDGCVVCRDCSVTKHKPHHVSDIRGAIIENTKETLSRLVGDACRLAYQAERSGKNCQEHLERCQENLRRRKEEIQTEARSLKGMIDVEAQRLCAEVEKHFQKEIQQIHGRQSTFNKSQSVIDDTADFSTKLLEYGNDSVVMTHANALQQKLRGLSGLQTTTEKPKGTEYDIIFVPAQRKSHDIKELFGDLRLERKDGSESSLPESEGNGLFFPPDRKDPKNDRESDTLSTNPIDIPSQEENPSSGVPLPSAVTPTDVWKPPTESPTSDTVSLAPSIRLTPNVFQPRDGVGVTSAFSAQLPREKRCKLYGCAIDNEGVIYLTDEGNKKLKLFTHTGHFMYDMDLKTNWPAGIALLKNGNVVIADNSKASFYDNLFRNPRGMVEIFAIKAKIKIKSVGDDKVKKPWGVATNSRSEILICDVYSKCVFVFKSDGSYKTTIPLGQCQYPMDIAVSPVSDSVYISDSYGHQIIGLGVHGEPLLKYGNKGQPGSGRGELKFPRGICVDARGHVFVADSENNRVVELRTNFSFLREVTIPDLVQPVAVAVNAMGQLVVVEWRGKVHVVQCRTDDQDGVEFSGSVAL